MVDPPFKAGVVDALAIPLATRFSEIPREEIRESLGHGIDDLAGKIAPEAFREMVYVLTHHRLNERVLSETNERQDRRQPHGQPSRRARRRTRRSSGSGPRRAD